MIYAPSFGSEAPPPPCFAPTSPPSEEVGALHLLPLEVRASHGGSRWDAYFVECFARGKKAEYKKVYFLKMGCSQVVRHRDLDPTFKGSNPFTPVFLQKKVCNTEKNVKKTLR